MSYTLSNEDVKELLKESGVADTSGAFDKSTDVIIEEDDYDGDGTCQDSTKVVGDTEDAFDTSLESYVGKLNYYVSDESSDHIDNLIESLEAYAEIAKHIEEHGENKVTQIAIESLAALNGISYSQEGIGDIIKSIWDFIVSCIMGVINFFRRIITWVWETITGRTKDIEKRANEVIKQAENITEEQAQQALSAVQGILEEANQNMIKSGGYASTNAKSGWEQVKEAGHKAKEVYGSISSMVKSFVESETGKRLGSAILSGGKMAGDGLVEAAKKGWDAYRNSDLHANLQEARQHKKEQRAEDKQLKKNVKEASRRREAMLAGAGDLATAVMQFRSVLGSGQCLAAIGASQNNLAVSVSKDEVNAIGQYLENSSKTMVSVVDAFQNNFLAPDPKEKITGMAVTGPGSDKDRVEGSLKEAAGGALSKKLIMDIGTFPELTRLKQAKMVSVGKMNKSNTKITATEVAYLDLTTYEQKSIVFYSGQIALAYKELNQTASALSSFAEEVKSDQQKGKKGLFNGIKYVTSSEAAATIERLFGFRPDDVKKSFQITSVIDFIKKTLVDNKEIMLLAKSFQRFDKEISDLETIYKRFKGIKWGSNAKSSSKNEAAYNAFKKITRFFLTSLQNVAKFMGDVAKSIDVYTRICNDIVKSGEAVIKAMSSDTLWSRGKMVADKIRSGKKEVDPNTRYKEVMDKFGL